jgi:hypothetical protein
MKKRFDKLSTKQIALILTSLTITLLLILEFLVRGTFYLYDKEWGYANEDIRYLPYVTYFNSPLRKKNTLSKNSTQFTKNKHSVILATDRYGFSLDSNDDPNRDLSRKTQCQYRVFMLGGSTAEGRFLSSEDDTLAARLEILLGKQHPKIDFQVINAGEGSFYSVQEVALHFFYIEYFSKPDHIIYFDGSNDFTLWPRNELPGVGGNMHPYANQLFRRAKSINTMGGAINLLFQRLSNWSAVIYGLHKSINYPPKLRVFLGVKNNEKTSSEEWVDRHLDRYFYNMKLALKSADKNTLVSYVFQPTLLPETPASREELILMKDYFRPNSFHGYNYFNNKQKFYERARFIFRNLGMTNKNPYSTVYDLSFLFSSKSKDETVFGDHVHYLSNARKIISQAIFDAIKPKVLEQLSSPQFVSCSKSFVKHN